MLPDAEFVNGSDIIIFRKEVMVLWQKSRTQQDVQRNPVPAVPVQERAQSKKVDMHEPMNMYSSIKKVIGVVSGKGGVGKSLVTASLARMMRAKGYNVGIMDADITGPSIPKMYGLHEMAVGTEQGILPCEAADGTKIMSVNLLLEDEEAPVIWRGPVIAGVVKQFWTDVMWGDLDYLFVDMPPGTGDVPLTVFQSLPV